MRIVTTSFASFAGDIINNRTITTTGTLRLEAVTGTGGVVNPNAQIISGSGIFQNATTSSTANVVGLLINNSNTTAGVTFANNMQVSGTFTHTAGIVNMGTNTLTVGTTTSLIGTYAYAAGRVVGKLKKFINAGPVSWTFPVGTLAANQNAIVNFTTAPSAAGSLTVEFKTGTPGTTNLPITQSGLEITDVSPTGYWTIDAGNSLAGGTYTITADASGFKNKAATPATLSSLTNLRLIKRPSAGNWIVATGTSAVDRKSVV